MIEGILNEDNSHLSDDLINSQIEVEHLKLAVESRTTIGQAQGILMERLHIDADQALEYLKRASSTSNRKLAQIAAEIAETRDLPTLD